MSKHHWNVTLTSGDVDFLREVAEFVNDILDTVEDETDEDDE